MNKKLLGIAVVMLFLLTPISAMSAMMAEREPASLIQSIIPQSEFVIVLDENEEVVWTADSVTRDDDIAYVTVETTVEAVGLRGRIVIPPQPLVWYIRAYKITARNWWGWPLFCTKAAGLASFSFMGKCVDIVDWSNGFSFCLRYTKEDFESHVDGVGSYCGYVKADGYFRDNLIRRYPRIHVWVQYEFEQSTVGGYLDWGD